MAAKAIINIVLEALQTALATIDSSWTVEYDLIDSAKLKKATIPLLMIQNEDEELPYETSGGVNTNNEVRIRLYFLIAKKGDDKTLEQNTSIGKIVDKVKTSIYAGITGNSTYDHKWLGDFRITKGEDTWLRMYGLPDIKTNKNLLAADIEFNMKYAMPAGLYNVDV